MGKTTRPAAQLCNPFVRNNQRMSEASLRRERDVIVRAVVLGWSISEYHVVGRSRLQVADHARCAVYALLRARGYSFPRIGRAMSRHHTSVMNGVRRAQEFFAHCARWRNSYQIACAAIELPGALPAPHDGRTPAPAPGQEVAQPTTPPR